MFFQKFFQKGRTNWLYLIIILIIAVLVGEASLFVCRQFSKERWESVSLSLTKKEKDFLTIEENIQDSLTGLLENQRDFNLFSVSYSDIHSLWGGLKLTIYGDGRAEQEVSRPVAPGKPLASSYEEARVSPEEIRELIVLLLNNRVWEQHGPERMGIPDESQAYLEIKFGNQSTQIWEWSNDLEKNKRISIILNFMQEITGFK